MSEPLTSERREAIRAKAPTYVAADSAIVVLDALEAAEAEVGRLRAELADVVPRDWHGLMAILDYAYPESIFPSTEDAMGRDPGPRIVSLIRHFDEARAQLARRDVWPHYTSTYCIHDLHEACRRTCKICEHPCLCDCHADSSGAA
jgi:hypothetical protein